MIALCLLLAVEATLTHVATGNDASNAKNRPVTKVINLLKDMQVLATYPSEFSALEFGGPFWSAFLDILPGDVVFLILLVKPDKATSRIRSHVH